MSDHEAAPERDLEELQDKTDQLADDIDEARTDWERKKADPAVPGAGGDPAAAQSGDQPETAYPAKGSDDELGEDLDTRDPANEDL